MKFSTGMVSLCFLAIAATHCMGIEMNTNVVLSFDEEAAKNRPVTKVINLLKDMLTQLEKESEEDQETYDKFVCWCTTNDKEKTKAIADAEARIESLTAKIGELTGLSSQLNTQISKLEDETAKEQTALDKATAMREKDFAEFEAEEKDALETIATLKSSVAAIAKHNSALIQVDTSQMQMIATKIQRVIQRHSNILNHILTPSDRKVVSAFIQSPEDYFDSEPTFKQSYAPQSGQIFGVLNQMKETFETNLAASQKEETTDQKGYVDLKAAKEAEITSGKKMIAKKTSELAETDEKNAEAQEDLADTKKTLAADQVFLENLKEQCSLIDAEFQERTKTRQLETEAVSKAMAVLSSDDARDLSSKTLGFVQTQSTAHSKRRDQASKVLASIAMKTHNPRFAALAYRVKLDGFGKIREMLANMVKDISKEKEDEIQHKDYCVEEFSQNDLTTIARKNDKTTVTELVTDLTTAIDSLNPHIDKIKAEITEIQIQLKRAGEDREAENKVFQEVVADQRMTQKLLKKALAVLEGFYGKAAFVQGQRKQPAGPPPPPGFKKYEKNQASEGIMGMMQQIIEDAKAMEQDALQSEGDAVTAYESFVKESNTSIEAKSKAIVNLTEEKAKAEVSKVNGEREIKSLEKELDDLAEEKAHLHKECDFLLKNFEISQAGKDEEMEALKQAIAIFQGA